MNNQQKIDSLPFSIRTTCEFAMAPSLFSPTDSASPTSALPTLASLLPSSNAESSDSSDSESATSDYIAPLSGHVADPSIDGSSVAEGNGPRAERAEDVAEDERAVGIFFLVRLRGGGPIGGLDWVWMIGVAGRAWGDRWQSSEEGRSAIALLFGDLAGEGRVAELRNELECASYGSHQSLWPDAESSEGD